MLQRVEAGSESVSLEMTQQAMASQGNVLMRTAQGDLFAFGPSTMASKEAMQIDKDNIQAVSVERYFDGPIQCQPRSRL
jgi:hypothetical protein